MTNLLIVACVLCAGSGTSSNENYSSYSSVGCWQQPFACSNLLYTSTGGFALED